MNDQGSLFAADDGLKPWQKGAVLRDKAIERVERNASEVLKDELLASVKLEAERHPNITSDDVWLDYHERMSVDPHEPRVLGAVMRMAAKEGWIVATDDFRLSVRPETHRNPKRVWRSTICRYVG